MQKQNIPEHILVESTRLFAIHGFQGTSLKTIAEAVGIRKASLLYHFESKDALRQAVLARVFGYWNEAVPRLLKVATTGDDRFEALMNEATHFFISDPNRARLLLREMLDRPEFMRSIIAEYLTPWMRIMEQYIRKGQQEGLLRGGVDVDAYILHVIQMILSSVAMHGVMMDVYQANAETTLRRHLDELLRIAHSSLFI